MEGTNWQRLLPDDHPGILEGKWCLNRFVPYACDVRALDAAGERAQRDAEELIGESEGAREKIESARARAPSERCSGGCVVIARRGRSADMRIPPKQKRYTRSA